MPLLSPALPVRSTPAWLLGLSEIRFEQRPLPLDDFICDCVYYPACEFDGFPLKYLARAFSSFVYVDYGQSLEALMRDVSKVGFTGYDVFFCRPVDQGELVPRGWRPNPQILQHVDVRQKMPRYSDFTRPGFAAWIILNRHAGKDDEHGPERLSLLYIGGDGVATYDALFRSRDTSPACLCLIRPGHCFGGNYTNFQDEGGLLASIVLEPGVKIPEFVVSDAHGAGHQGCWPVAYPYFHRPTSGINVRPGLWSRTPMSKVET